jgi:hypothetical protein
VKIEERMAKETARAVEEKLAKETAKLLEERMARVELNAVQLVESNNARKKEQASDPVLLELKNDLTKVKTELAKAEENAKGLQQQLTGTSKMSFFKK